MAILGMSLSGISEARNILIAFALIGMLTATWRCAGTIPSIVCYAFGIVRPSWFLIAAFLINSLISFLTGTSFGSVATMGVICMTMGNALGISPALTGGAILSGIFFGDRCSPVSTSALLVADITKTGIFGNISGMMRTGAVPFAAACIIYGVLSISSSGSGTASAEFTALFRGEFRIGLMPLLPAAVMLVLSLMRMDTRTTMAASIAAAIAVAIPYQGIGISSLPELLISGYKSPSPELSAAIDGGGMRGIIPAAILGRMNEYLRSKGDARPLYSHFDLIAGTSTGALLAAALSIGTAALGLPSWLSAGVSPDIAVVKGNPAAATRAAVELPGMPKLSRGTMELATTALLAASEPAMPSGEP